MKHSLTPGYLTSLVQENVGQTTNYNLRNAHDTGGITCHSKLFTNSFLPSVVNLWNKLTLDQRDSPTLESIKRTLCSNIEKSLSYYYAGEPKYKIQHSRLRTHCSSLKEYLYTKIIVDSP